MNNYCRFSSCFVELATKHDLPLVFWICDRNNNFIFLSNDIGKELNKRDICGQVIKTQQPAHYQIEHAGRTWDCVLEPCDNGGCQSIAIEITRTVTLEDKWNTLIRSCPFAIALVDQNKKIVESSPAFYNMLGYEREEFIGKSYEEFTHPDDIKDDVKNHTKLLTGELEKYAIRKRYIKKNGKVIHALLETGIVASTKMTIAYIHDLTEEFEISDNLRMDQAALRGIFEQEFILHYQPIVKLCDRNIVGYEGLVRWVQDDLMLSPGEFLPRLSPQTMLLLTLEIVRLVSLQLKALTLRGEEKLWLAINLSPHDIGTRGFLSRFNAILETHQVDRTRLRLEVTEQDILNESWMLQALEALKSQGHTIEIDDFGSGYSNLGSLVTYPISVIKIDKSLTDGIPGDRAKEKLLRLIVSFAEALDYK
jgi:PAS domain S-box-containing protein